MKGLSVKLIQSAPILLTFDLVHEGAVFDRSALINPRSEGRRILKKIIREDRRGKKKEKHPNKDGGPSGPPQVTLSWEQNIWTQ